MTIASTDVLGTLPALKKLGHLADVRPVVVIDTREQEPLPISRLAVVRTGLQTADYSFQGGEHLFGVERKSIGDLVGCCMGENRARFEREMHRLRGFRFKRLLIIGSRSMIEDQQYKSRIKPLAVLHSLDAWEGEVRPARGLRRGSDPGRGARGEVGVVVCTPDGRGCQRPFSR